MRQQRLTRHLRGFTLVELLVVIAIIGVLVGATLPALMASREAGRRNQCHANLAQVLLGLHGYQDAYGSLPSGVADPTGPIQSEPKGLHQGWLIATLPFIDEQNAYALVDHSASVYAPENDKVRDYRPHLLVCPSEPNEIAGASNFAGCHHDVEAPIDADNHGLLFRNSGIRPDEVPDGLAHTLLVGEKRVDDVRDLGWMSGTRATLRNTGLTPNDPSKGLVTVGIFQGAAPATYVGGFGSGHPNGAHGGFADGSVRFVSEGIERQLWQNLGNRSDGQLTSFREPGD